MGMVVGMTNAPRIMTVQDQMKIARANGIEEGQRLMRDRITHEIGVWAYSHPDPVIVDELHILVERLRKLVTS
jgi:hypothetical protein